MKMRKFRDMTDTSSAHDIIEELKRIHVEYLAKVRAIQAEQKELMKSVIERIDKEKAGEIMKKITEEDQEI